MNRDMIESREIDGEGNPITVTLWQDDHDGEIVWRVQLDGEVWAEIPGQRGGIIARAIYSAICDHITEYMHVVKLNPLVVACAPR